MVKTPHITQLVEYHPDMMEDEGSSPSMRT